MLIALNGIGTAHYDTRLAVAEFLLKKEHRYREPGISVYANREFIKKFFRKESNMGTLFNKVHFIKNTSSFIAFLHCQSFRKSGKIKKFNFLTLWANGFHWEGRGGGQNSQYYIKQFFFLVTVIIIIIDIIFQVFHDYLK